MSSICLPVFGFESAYLVSSDGAVIRKSGPYRKQQKQLKQYIDHRGYARVKLSLCGKTSMHAVHKLVAQAFLKVAKDDLTINHLDGNKLNNHPSNLEYCTRKENTQHAVSIGRISLSGAKITREIAEDIRSRYLRGSESSKLLAQEFGLTKRTICRIASGQLWAKK